MKEQIEELISKIRKEYDINEKYYIDIVKLAKKHGITIGRAYLKEFDGFLILNGNKNQNIIGVNATKSLYLKRFIAAYALGLYYKKDSNKDTYIDRIKLDGVYIDIDMVYFAAALLVPKDSFCEKYNEFKEAGLKDDHICTVLSELYKVPEEVIRYRRDNLIPQINRTTLATHYQTCENSEIDCAIRTLSSIKK